MPEAKVVRNPGAADVVSDRRLWLDAKKERVVEDGDPDAAFLLVGEGSNFPAAEAEGLGLTIRGGKIVLPEPPSAPAAEE